MLAAIVSEFLYDWASAESVQDFVDTVIVQKEFVLIKVFSTMIICTVYIIKVLHQHKKPTKNSVINSKKANPQNQK